MTTPEDIAALSAAVRRLAAQRYVSVATCRRDGREVRTAVWLVALGERLYCYSAKNAGKVKRVRRQGRARLAPCSVRGELTGTWHDASARVVSEDALTTAVYAALRKKYGWQMRAADVLASLSGRRAARAVLEFEVLPADVTAPTPHPSGTP